MAFECYGIENYLLDFYTGDIKFDDLKKNIANSDEKEVGFSFVFDFNESTENIKNLLCFIKREGFYY